MKNSKLILVLGFIFTISGAFGQDYAFKVLANKGTNEVKSGDSWQALKTGASLNATDEVRLAENAYLGLIHKTGKPIEVKQAGSYKVADLASQVKGGTSVLNKYTDFILSSNSAEAQKNRLSATGAVHRGAKGLRVYLPDAQFANVLNKRVVIRWEEVKGGSPFVVILKNMFDDEILKKETTEARLEIDLSDPKLSNESAILVEIRSLSDPELKTEKNLLIKKLPAAQLEALTKEMETLTQQVDTQTAISKYIMTGFYEEKNLFIDAVTAYEDLIKMAPDVPSYKESYEEFLLRNKFKEPK